MPLSNVADVQSNSVQHLRTRLVGVMVFRTFVTAMALAAILLRRLTVPVGEELTRVDSIAFGLIGAVFALTLGYALAIRRGRVTPALAFGQVVGDVVLSAALVFLTGVVESPLTFAFLVAIVLGALTLGEVGALVAAVLSSVVFSSLSVASNVGLITGPFHGDALPTGQLVFAVFSSVAAQFMVGGLASYLARQVTSADGRVTQRDARIKSLLDIQDQIVTAMPSGLLTCDVSGAVTYANPAAAFILHDARSLVGASVHTLLPGFPTVPHEVKRRELAFRSAQGEQVVGLSITPLGPPAQGFLVVFQDLTGLRRAEEQLRRADHLASLGKLSAQLAHEIRNPLAAMRGAAQMLAGGTPADATTKLTEILLRESDRLNRLVKEFLVFARPPAPTLERVNVAELAQRVLELVAHDPLAAGVKVEFLDEPAFAMVDPSQLQQAVLNIVRNAFEAVAHQGVVRVTTRRVHEQVELLVWDSAGKIAEADLARIFEPFFTTRSGGTGLGLSTAHSIVQSHGGQIRVESDVAKGTLFTIQLAAT